MILVYGGVQADGDGGPVRLPVSAIADVELRVRRLLTHLRPRMVLGAAASGADLIVADAARSLRIPLRLLLPHDRRTFRRTSVEPRGEPWLTRYDRLLSELDPAGVETGDDDPADEQVYNRHNQRLLDRAGELVPDGEQVWVLVIRPADGASSSVSDDLAHRAEERGLPVLDLDPALDSGPAGFSGPD